MTGEIEIEVNPFAPVDAEETETTEVESEPEPESPDQLSDIEREHYKQIKEANRCVSDVQWAYDLANDKAKALKKQLEIRSLELSSLISEGPRRPDPQRTLPFSDEAEESADEQNQDWAATPVDDVITLTANQREKLESVGVTTIGQFEHIRGCNNYEYPDGLRSIKGIGEKTVDKWEDQVIEWLSVNARESDEGGEEVL